MSGEVANPNKFLLIGGCVNKQSDPPEEQYRSTLFLQRKEYAELCQAKRFNRWFLLSPKHGLLESGFSAPNRDVFLNSLSHAEQVNWFAGVVKQFTEFWLNDAMSLKEPGYVEVEIHAQWNFSGPLVRMLTALGFQATTQLAEAPLDRQLHHYAKALETQRPFS